MQKKLFLKLLLYDLKDYIFYKHERWSNGARIKVIFLLNCRTFAYQRPELFKKIVNC